MSSLPNAPVPAKPLHRITAVRSTAVRFAAVVIGAGLVAAACGSSGDSPVASDAEPNVGDQSTAAPRSGEATGIRLVDAEQAAAIQASPPQDLVILDVRTPEEFDSGHIDGAIMIDFYEEDFADQLALLDHDIPYLLYCRSGNRSGQTAAILEDLGFSDVADVDGGVIAWADAGLPLVDG